MVLTLLGLSSLLHAQTRQVFCKDILLYRKQFLAAVPFMQWNLPTVLGYMWLLDDVLFHTSHQMINPTMGAGKKIRPIASVRPAKVLAQLMKKKYGRNSGEH